MSDNNRRRRLFIEPRMQGILCFKILIYWLNGFLTIGLLIACLSFFTERPQTSAELATLTWQKIWPALLASLVLLPLILTDCVRWSNRFAGPMVRMSQALHALAERRDVAPLKLRQGDLWYEMAEDFNRIAAQRQTGQTAESAGADREQQSLAGV
ncbi:MAG: hypothetical protein KDA41_08880 [Planctomycetales bacterium]|nr:hypothetical protein [Planctomycetales bacterium]